MRISRVCLFLTVYIGLVSVVSANAQLPQCSDQGTWSPQAFLPGAVVLMSSPLLLTDGRVMAQYITGLSTGDPWQDWYALTPSITGCYSRNSADCVGGHTATWSELASISSVTNLYGPAAFASAVLPDGNVIIEGGEDNFGARVEYNGGAYYDSGANTWVTVNPPSGWKYIGDAPSVVLADGTFMLGNACGNFHGSGMTALFDEASMSWTAMQPPPEWTSEAGFTLLPDDSVLFVGTCWPGQAANHTCTTSANPLNSVAYNATTGTWGTLGSTIEQLYSYDTPPGTVGANSCFAHQPIFGEQGPAALLPTGKYFATGGYNATANVVYTSVYDTATSTWAGSPPLPSVKIGASTYPLTAEDQGSVVLPDGNLLLATRARIAAHDDSGPYYIEWNGKTGYCQLNSLPAGLPGQAEMLTLPTGQILITGVSWGSTPRNYFIYTPGGVPYPGIEPATTSVPSTIARGGTYTVSGLQFNGATQSSFFGDDFQNATNYPLVRITNASGRVFYAKTHNPSTMAVATGATTVSTMFDVPTATELGSSTLVVVANGIESKPVAVTVVP